MVLPGHLAGGYLATRALLSLTHATFSSTKTTALLIIGTLAGDGPDIDLFWYSFKHRVLKSQVKDDHREYVSHAPLLWLAVCLVIALIGLLVGSVFTEFIGLAILVGSWSHLILDSVEHGVMWLWPLSSKLFSVSSHRDPEVPGEPGSVRAYWNFIVKAYPKRITFWLEIIVTLIGIYVLVH